MTADIGSLRFLGDINEEEGGGLIRNSYTEGYASPKYIEAVK
jgi:hypothetical protein